MTHIHIIRNPSENFYLVGSPAENVFVAASQITLLNYYAMRIATNSDAVNKSGKISANPESEHLVPYVYHVELIS